MKYHSTKPYRSQEEFNRVLWVALSNSSSLLIVCPGFKDSLDDVLIGFFGAGLKTLKGGKELEFNFGGRVVSIYMEYGSKSRFTSGNAFLPWVSPVAAYEVIQNDKRVTDTYFIPNSGADAVARGGKDDLKGYLGNFPESKKI